MSVSDVNFWIEGDISTTRVVSRFLNDMLGAGNCHTRLLRSVDWATLVKSLNIFCRVCDPSYKWLPAYMKKRGISYVYYIDDNFWKINGKSDLARYYQNNDVVTSLDEFVRYSSLVITHSQALADFVEYRFPDVRCVLLKAPFDMSLAREELQNIPPRVKKGAVVGYAGGYKKEEFELLEDVISKLDAERPDIRFEFIGGVSDRLRTFKNVQWFPGLSDYAAYISFKISRRWSIGLGPLLESEFNASKTDNKFREYGGCRIPGIYSDTGPFVDSVTPGVYGILVKNKVDAWAAAIEKLVDDEVLHESIAQAAFTYVDSTYSHDALIPSWREALLIDRGKSPSSWRDCIRFRCAKLFYVHSSVSEIAILEKMSTAALAWRGFKSQAVSFLLRKRRHVTLLGTAILLLVILFTLLNANLFFIKQTWLE